MGFKCGIVGLPNVGKSTLMNLLTKAGVPVANKLFATLDSTTRTLSRTHRPAILVSDTVGFIRKLPHHLVASFRSTLEVVCDAHLLLEVVDLSHPDYAAQMQTTQEVLEAIGAEYVPKILVFNKIDQAPHMHLALARKKHPGALFLSALTGDAQALFARVEAFFRQGMVRIPMRLAYAQTGGLQKLERFGQVEDVLYHEEGVAFTFITTPRNLSRVHADLPWAISGEATPQH